MGRPEPSSVEDQFVLALNFLSMRHVPLHLERYIRMHEFEPLLSALKPLSKL